MPLYLYEKEQILDACFVVFVTYGYTNTSTAMLADAAGISKALIFHHFNSKKELYLSILGRCFNKMASDISIDSLSEYNDFFEARLKSGFRKIDYLKENPDVSKLLFEAFYETPDELKTDIRQFERQLEENHGAQQNAKDLKMKQLFDKIHLRDGVNNEQAYELINIIMDYFNKNNLSVLADESKLLDEEYWQEFMAKKNNFLDMLRYGIEQKNN